MDLTVQQFLLFVQSPSKEASTFLTGLCLGTRPFFVKQYIKILYFIRENKMHVNFGYGGSGHHKEDAHPFIPRLWVAPTCDTNAVI